MKVHLRSFKKSRDKLLKLVQLVKGTGSSRAKESGRDLGGDPGRKGKGTESSQIPA
jgi:hypothetical protein